MTPDSNSIASLRQHLSRHRHCLRHGGDADADAGYDHRQRGDALYPGFARGLAGPDHLDSHRLYRRGSDHDPADRLARSAIWPKSLFLISARRFHSRFDALRHRESLTEIVLFRALQGVFGAAVVPLSQSDHARHLSARAARPGHGALGYGRCGRAGPGTDAGRLSDRFLQLALGILHQCAHRHHR